jgi:dTDP-4-dehydrorhamnose 3,5-epimerase
VNYKVDNFYNPKSDSGIIWNDKDLSIDWNLDLKPTLSKKDLNLILFKELNSPF